VGCRQRGQCPGERPVADHDGAKDAALGPEAADHLDEPIRAFLGCERTHEYERGFSRLGRLGAGTESGWVSSIGYHDGPLWGNAEPTGALVVHLVTDGHDELCSCHDAPPWPFMEPRGSSGVGADDAVDQRTPGAEHPRQGVFHRVTTMCDHCCRIELGEEPAQSEGETGVESLAGTVARGMPQGQVDLHLGRAVEKSK
jgi:hypothetical protein